MATFFQEDYAAQGIQAMKEDMLDHQFKLNVEYRVGGQVTKISCPLKLSRKEIHNLTGPFQRLTLKLLRP
jgi:hypothetical protein